MEIVQKCPGCAATIGKFHGDQCDVARCALTGRQRFGCSHKKYDCNTVWWGIWPGQAECNEYGLWTRWTSNGWVPCSKDDPDATEDLNTLVIRGKWSIALQKMVVS